MCVTSMGKIYKNTRLVFVHGPFDSIYIMAIVREYTEFGESEKFTCQLIQSPLKSVYDHYYGPVRSCTDFGDS